MFIESFAGSLVDKNDIQVQKSCSALILIVTGAAAVNTTLVSVRLVGKNGNVELMNKIPLLDVAEIMGQDEGLYAKSLANYVGNLPFAGTLSIIMIPVAINGGYELQDDEYLSVDFNAMNASSTYRLHALEEIDLDGQLYEIDKKAVAAPRQNQRWTASGAHMLALPRTNFDKIQLFGKDSTGKMRDKTLTFEEAAAKSFFDNDIVAVNTRNVATTPAVNVIDNLYGFDNLILINLEGIDYYEITCSGVAGYSFYQVKFV